MATEAARCSSDNTAFERRCVSPQLEVILHRWAEFYLLQACCSRPTTSSPCFVCGFIAQRLCDHQQNTVEHKDKNAGNLIVSLFANMSNHKLCWFPPCSPDPVTARVKSLKCIVPPSETPFLKLSGKRTLCLPRICSDRTL